MKRSIETQDELKVVAAVVWIHSIIVIINKIAMNSSFVAVLQKRVFENYFQPVFSLVIRGGRFGWPCNKSFLNCYQMLDKQLMTIGSNNF